MSRLGLEGLQIAKDLDGRAAELGHAIVAAGASLSSTVRLAGVELDKRLTAFRLGRQPTDPFPLPHTMYATEAEALLGCATPWSGGALLFGVVRTLRPERILEFGGAHGYGAIYMGLAARANGRGHVWSLEGMRVRAGLARRAISRFGLSRHVTVVEEPFEQSVPRLLDEAPPDLVFSDGSKQPTETEGHLRDVVASMPGGGHILFDDINHGQSALELWLEATRHPRVTDALTFNRRWGLLRITPVAQD
jgi:predicted O-methyltransferase YrrM